jgi:hypothetical protein
MSSGSAITVPRPKGLRSLAVEVRLFIGLVILILWLFTR